MKWWWVWGFCFLFFRCCTLDSHIDTLQRDQANLNGIVNEIIERMETQYRFTERVMKRVNKMERGVDKHQNRVYIKARNGKKEQK
jgi:hypothetical protein